MSAVRPLGEMCNRQGMHWTEFGERWCWGYIDEMTDEYLSECREYERWCINRKLEMEER